jgi:hypothetical protein
MPENLDSEQSRRLWEHRLHIENLLYSRLNFFVLLGFCISIVWLYVQHNVKQLLFVLHDRARDNFPEFNKSMRSMLSKRRAVGRLGTENPATMFLTYGVPCLVALVWICLLFFL